MRKQPGRVDGKGASVHDCICEGSAVCIVGVKDPCAMHFGGRDYKGVRSQHLPSHRDICRPHRFSDFEKIGRQGGAFNIERLYYKFSVDRINDGRVQSFVGRNQVFSDDDRGD